MGAERLPWMGIAETPWTGGSPGGSRDWIICWLVLALSLGWGVFIPCPLLSSPPIWESPRVLVVALVVMVTLGVLVALILMTLMLVVAGQCASTIPWGPPGMAGCEWCTPVQVRAHTCASLCVCRGAFVHACTCSCVHARVWLCMHVCTHTPVLPPSPPGACLYLPAGWGLTAALR